MNITSIQLHIINEDKLKAFATLTIEECFVIRDIKIIRGHSGLFVAMPAKKGKDGVYRDIAHPINQSTRSELEEKILIAYQEQSKALNEGPKPPIVHDINSESLNEIKVAQ